ncbi:MAG: ABC transporter ATP-binding protein [Mycobacteriales bacterium]
MEDNQSGAQEQPGRTGPARTPSAASTPTGEAGPSYDHLQARLEARTQRRSFRRLLPLLTDSIGLVYRSSPRVLMVTAVLQIGIALLAGLQVVVGERALRALLAADGAQGSATDALPPLALLAALAAVAAAATALLAQRQRLLGELVQRTVWRRVLGVTTSVDLDRFEDPIFFDELQRVQTNAVTRPLDLTQGLIGLVGGLAGAAALIAALLTLEPLLVPLLLTAGVPLFLLNRKGGRLEFAFAVEQTPPMRERQYLRTALTGKDEAKEVRAFGLSPALMSRYESLYASYLTALRRLIRRRTSLVLLGTLATAVVTAITLGLLLVLVDADRLTLAEAGAATLAIRLLTSRLELLAAGLGKVYESALFLNDFRAFLSRAQPGPAITDSDHAPPPFRHLAVQGLTFHYPGTDVPALSDVDLEVRAGEVVALVGENGSGKTTLAKLLAQLYRPTSGRITWDGRDVGDLDARALRRSIAVIFQDFVRYQLTAQQNIGVGRPEAIDDNEAVMAAARQAGAHDYLSRLPRGYDTVLSKAFVGGRDLSVGQWQRVALARAYYRNAPFVILDEPSAALDPRAEADLFGNLRTLLAGRTVLFISHRFSSVRNADRIYVLRAGRVVESGTHDALMALDGLYAELFTLQAKAYLPDDSAARSSGPG